MDEIFGSPKMIRQPLEVNNNRSRKQEFKYQPERRVVNSKTHIRVWNGYGRGVQGETTNSSTNAFQRPVRRTWTP